MGIPGECQMDCVKLKVTESGAKSGDPTQVASNQMFGMWAQRGFHASWDGKTIISHSFDGFRVTRGSETRDYKVQLLHRNMFWSPDSKHFVFWLPAGVALAEVDDLGPPGGPPKSKIIYKAPAGRYPFGLTWSPTGTDVYVIEHYEEEAGPGKLNTGTSIKRVPISGGGAVEILKHPVEVAFFMPPDSWYEDGSGPKTQPYKIVFGAKDGLYLMDRDGQNKAKLADVPPDGVGDVLWDPSGKDQFMVLFRQPGTTASKKTIRGLYLVHADKKGAKEDQILEQLSPELDLHTEYFSKKGKYVCWANGEAMFFRETAKQENPTKIVIPDAAGLEFKGFTWDDAEKRILIAIANRLYLYDLANKSATLLVKAGEDGKTFIAEPSWHGDEIVYSTFTNTAAKRKIEEPKDNKGQGQPQPPKK